MTISSVPLFWRLQKSKYLMIGTKCSVCNNVFFPPKNFCPNCRRKGKIEELKFSGLGKIISHTVIRAAPNGFEKYAPYAVAIVELDEGTRITGQITSEIDKVATGKRVRSIFRKLSEDGNKGLIHYGFKFEVVE